MHGINTFFREGGKSMKKVRLAMSARQVVRDMDGKLRRIKKKTYTWKSIPA
jgi:hypothetical protein